MAVSVEHFATKQNGRKTTHSFKREAPERVHDESMTPHIRPVQPSPPSTPPTPLFYLSLSWSFLVSTTLPVACDSLAPAPTAVGVCVCVLIARRCLLGRAELKEERDNAHNACENEEERTVVAADVLAAVHGLASASRGLDLLHVALDLPDE